MSQEGEGGAQEEVGQREVTKAKQCYMQGYAIQVV